MTDEPNVNKYMGGYDDAAQFTKADPPPPKPVRRVDSGRVDPHLTHYVGVEAAKELRVLFEEMMGLSVEWYKASVYGELNPTLDEPVVMPHYRARLNDILGLQE